MKNYFWLLIFTCFGYSAVGHVSGIVFRDFNGNGTKDTNEPHKAGVLVNFYDNFGASCGTATSTNGLTATIYSVTTANRDARTNDETVANTSVIAFTLATAGQNNHSYDFGFRAAPIGTIPSGVTTTQTAPTCTGTTPNNNGVINVTAVTDADKYGVSTGGTYTGPDYATATVLPALPFAAQSMIPNAGGTYTIRFFNGADGCFVDEVVVIPSNTCTTPCPAPRLITPCYTFGSYENSNIDALVSIPATSNVNPYENGIAHHDSVAHLATFGQIGSTYGLAYKESTQTIFAAAYIKRHAALGPNGTGAIYQIDPTGINPPSLFMDLNSIFGANTAGINPHPYAPTDVCPDGSGGNSNFACWFNDVNTWNAVGRQGLGDLDISEDGAYLFVMNMTNKSVYKIPTVSPSLSNIEIFPFPTTLPNAVVACGNPQQVRPMGLGVKNGLVYVGAICTEEIDNPGGGAFGGDKIYIYALDPVTGLWSTSPELEGNIGRSNLRAFQWPASFQDSYADGVHMILSDIDFGSNGEMFLGIRDISGDRFGNEAGKPIAGDQNIVFYPVTGDILKACLDTNTGKYILEENGSCGGITTNGAANGNGIPSTTANAKEYFNDDLQNNTNHPETSLGGVAYYPPTDEVFISAYDILGVFQAGFIGLDNTTGERTASFVLIEDTTPQGQFGKTNGLGDVEIICTASFVCIPPIVTLSLTPPTCTGSTLNNNGIITVTAVTNADKYGVSIGGTYIGPNYAAASTLSGLPFDAQTAIPNSGGAYTIRFFNGDNACFTDQVVTVAAVTCSACPVTNYELCPNESYTLTAGTGLTNIQWFRNGTMIPGANSMNYIATQIGSYTYTADQTSSGCPGGTCCPVEIIAGTMCCTVSAANPMTTCNDAGTGSTPNDDYFTVTLNPTGVGIGTTYSVSGGITANNVPYGSAQQVGGNFLISSGNLTITITDDVSGATCQLTNVMIMAPAPCSIPVDRPTTVPPGVAAPCHVIDTDLRLGLTNAVDDMLQTVADDGLTVVPTTATPGSTLNLEMEVYNNKGVDAYLVGWIDWNGNGVLDPATEQVISQTITAQGTSFVPVTIMIPANAPQDVDIVSAFRLSTQSGLGPYGEVCAPDGEYENYMFRFSCPTPLCLPVTFTRN